VGGDGRVADGQRGGQTKKDTSWGLGTATVTLFPPGGTGIRSQLPKSGEKMFKIQDTIHAKEHPDLSTNSHRQIKFSRGRKGTILLRDTLQNVKKRFLGTMARKKSLQGRLRASGEEKPRGEDYT